MAAVLAAVGLAGAGTPPAASRPPEFWRQIVRAGYAVPEGGSPGDLLQDLTAYLGSRDPQLRDDLGYGIPAAWIYRQRVVPREDLGRLLALWSTGLREGVGEVGTDSVLRRSFSALDLSLLAALDLEEPFLEEAQYRGLLDAGLAYLAAERDLRGFDPEVGWVHAVAHTADLIKFLARSPRLRPGDQGRILDGVAGRLESAGTVFVFGEDERLAAAVRSLLRREDLDRAGLERWLGRLHQLRRRPWEAVRPEIATLAAARNATNLARALLVVAAAPDASPGESAIQPRLLQVLRGP